MKGERGRTCDGDRNKQTAHAQMSVTAAPDAVSRARIIINMVATWDQILELTVVTKVSASAHPSFGSRATHAMQHKLFGLSLESLVRTVGGISKAGPRYGGLAS